MKAPEAMNRMWSVLIMPYLVFTVQPSISGSRSRCTPSRDASAPPWASPRWAHLVDFVDKHDAVLLDRFQCVGFEFLFVDQLAGLLFLQHASRHPSPCPLAVFACPEPRLENRLCSWLVISSMPGGAMMSTPTDDRPDRFRSRGHPAGLRAVSCGKSGACGCRWATARCQTDTCRRQQRIQNAFFGALRRDAATFCISCSRVILIAMLRRGRG
jgi:hypothetical protein